MIVQTVTRRRSEKALAKSRNLLEEMIDFLPDATLAVDSSQRIIAWNRIMEELTGIPPAAVLNKCQDFSECTYRYPGVSSLIERILILGERTTGDPDNHGIENRIITEKYHGHVDAEDDNGARHSLTMVRPALNARPSNKEAPKVRNMSAPPR